MRIMCCFVHSGDLILVKSQVYLLFSVHLTAKKLPKNEPQNAGASSARGRGVDLTEPTQPPKSQCCSN